MLSPLAIKSLHIIDGHGHSICSNFDVHIHQKELDCNIDLYHFSPFDFSITSYSLTSREPVPERTEVALVLMHIDSQIPAQSLRAPPVQL